MIPFFLISENTFSAQCSCALLENHTEANHGDVCRDAQSKNFNCPTACFKRTDNKAPFCQKSATNDKPCRV